MELVKWLSFRKAEGFLGRKKAMVGGNKMELQITEMDIVQPYTATTKAGQNRKADQKREGTTKEFEEWFYGC